MKFNFWKPFVRYQGGDTLLASVEQLQTIFKDYGSNTHLYEIFIGEKEGNFQGLEEGNIETWYFVVDPDSKHPLEYNPHLFTADLLQCYILDSGTAKVDKATLCRYHNSYTEPDKSTHYIGIGVKRIGPESYNPDGDNQENQQNPEFFTAVTYEDDWAIWWPSFGDLVVAVDDEHGGIEHVLMDGSELDLSDNTVEGGRIVLSQAYLSSLAYGKHELYLDAEGGGHTLLFYTQPDGIYRTVSGDGSTWTAGSNEGTTFTFKRDTGDYQTIYRLTGVLVDGVQVPSWGYVTSAGSAVVSLTSEFLATLSKGAHTITAVFSDGNDPQASFTVTGGGTQNNSSASATKTASTTGSTIASTARLPKTGDESARAMMLMLVLALTSFCAAAYVRRGAKTL